MRKDYEQLLANIEGHEPPVGLLDRIMSRIAEERRHRARIRVACFGTLSLAAILTLVTASRELYVELMQSGFPQFISLLFSDAGILAAYWKEFAFSLAESFPIFAASMVLASVFVLLFSLRFLARDTDTMFRQPNLANV